MCLPTGVSHLDDLLFKFLCSVCPLTAASHLGDRSRHFFCALSVAACILLSRSNLCPEEKVSAPSLSHATDDQRVQHNFREHAFDVLKVNVIHDFFSRFDSTWLRSDTAINICQSRRRRRRRRRRRKSHHHNGKTTVTRTTTSLCVLSVQRAGYRASWHVTKLTLATTVFTVPHSSQVYGYVQKGAH